MVLLGVVSGMPHVYFAESAYGFQEESWQRADCSYATLITGGFSGEEMVLNSFTCSLSLSSLFRRSHASSHVDMMCIHGSSNLVKCARTHTHAQHESSKQEQE